MSFAKNHNTASEIKFYKSGCKKGTQHVTSTKGLFRTATSQLKLIMFSRTSMPLGANGAVKDPSSIYNSGKYTDPICSESACLRIWASELDELMSSGRRKPQAQVTSSYHRGGDSHLPCRVSSVDADVCTSDFPDNQGREIGDSLRHREHLNTP